MTKAHQLTSHKAKPLNGTITVPGDKSISHRALMFGSLAIGETTVTGLLTGEDVLSTAAAMRALGAQIETDPDGTWRIHGVGIGGLHEPDQVLDMGNSGTSARLLMGLIGSHPITATMTGDASLIKRPMGRVITPLEKMGTTFLARGGKLPLTMQGPDDPLAITYELPVASAQVKSAVLLAGLNAAGRTTVIEHKPTRDHTENMLRHFSADVTTEEQPDGSFAVSIPGHQDLKPSHISIPGDPSSAAFPIMAALLIPDSDITLKNIGMNPRRTGLLETLIEMGADITYSHEQILSGEPVADIRVKYSGALKGTEVPPERVPAMIDEFPILAVATACAAGTTKMTGLAELRVKESDRLAMMATGLSACGVNLEEGPDSLTIHGTGKPPQGGANVATALDHRIAMSFLILGAVTDEPVVIDDARPINTSFPGFVELMNNVGCAIE